MSLLTLSSDGRAGEFLIYEDIGPGWWDEGITGKVVHEELRAAGESLQELTVRINSFGGSVTDGNAIYNALVRHKAKVTVEIDGIAASAASVIAMAGDSIRIAKNGLLMIHEAWGFTQGDAKDHESTARVLRKMSEAAADIYAARSGLPKDELLQLMADETWFSADEALAKGLATEVIAAKEPPQARFNPNGVMKSFRHAPKDLVARLGAPKKSPAPQPPQQTKRADSARASAKGRAPSAFAQLAGARTPRLGDR